MLFIHLRRVPLTARRSYTTSSNFTYSLGIGYHGKSSAPSKSKYSLPKHSAIAHWRDEQLKGSTVKAGEDFFYSERLKDGVSLGVCDGVGSWSDHGVEMCYYSSQEAIQHYNANSTLQDPGTTMEQAYIKVLEDSHVFAGSTTSCNLTLSNSGILKAANLGDSTFVILRKEKVFHFQPAQTHCEFIKTPDGQVADLPRQADLVEIPLQNDDVVLVMTDGVSDNVFGDEMELIWKKTTSTNATPQEHASSFAKTLVMFARLVGQREDKITPFEVEAKKHGYEYKGGKLDDATVLTAIAHCNT